jgi:hypothetical protein
MKREGTSVNVWRLVHLHVGEVLDLLLAPRSTFLTEVLVVFLGAYRRNAEMVFSVRPRPLLNSLVSVNGFAFDCV